jgi:adenosylcobinamide-phosphate synthase
MIEARFMGEGGNAHLTVWHIHIALKLARVADAMLIGLFGVLALVIWLI